MSDDITFEDGRGCTLASSLFAAILEQTAKCAPSSLSLWLSDLAKRPNGLMSFDVRGLAADVREEFYAALQAASPAQLAAETNRQLLSESRILRAWRKLMEAYKLSAGQRLPIDDVACRRFQWDGQAIDIQLLWYCPSCTAALDPLPNSNCSDCGWQHPDVLRAAH